jgi:hypothetical protein
MENDDSASADLRNRIVRKNQKKRSAFLTGFHSLEGRGETQRLYVGGNHFAAKHLSRRAAEQQSPSKFTGLFKSVSIEV